MSSAGSAGLAAPTRAAYPADVGARCRMLIVGLVLVFASVPGGALAVRPSVSPAENVRYVGSDPEGPVTFLMMILTDKAPTPVTYIMNGMRFATECSRSGSRAPGEIVITRHRTRASQQPRFGYHRDGFIIHGHISGSLGAPRVTGTVQLDRPGCDGDPLPFTARLQR
jgi:hypothetical protein